jgi:hypothetical protein
VITHQVDFESERAIESAALLASKDAPLDLVIIATGLLHDAEQKPEKSLKALSSEKNATPLRNQYNIASDASKTLYASS